MLTTIWYAVFINDVILSNPSPFTDQRNTLTNLAICYQIFQILFHHLLQYKYGPDKPGAIAWWILTELWLKQKTEINITWLGSRYLSVRIVLFNLNKGLFIQPIVKQPIIWISIVVCLKQNLSYEEKY